MRVLRIVEGTSVDGPGLRTSIYLAGCRHHCPGCHNPGSWDRDGGREMSCEELMEVIADNDADVTFSGGDPLLQAEELSDLCRLIKASDRPYNIWCYTGYLYEEVAGDETLSRVLPYIDVMVDGRYEAERRDITLLFRGSSNQRLIDVQASLRAGRVCLYESAFS